MRKLLPFEETRAPVRQMGFDTKEEYKFGIKGPYFVRDPDLVYEEDWRGWDDYLGCMLPFEEARVVSRSVCKRLGVIPFARDCEALCGGAVRQVGHTVTFIGERPDAHALLRAAHKHSAGQSYREDRMHGEARAVRQ